MLQEELIIFPIRKDRNISMRPIRQREQHQSSGKILPERISWILRQAEQQGNVLKDESLSLHFQKVLLSTRQMTNFKPIEFDRFKAESGDNAFTLTP
mgnify:FL=1